MWYIHAMKYYPDIKRNEVLIHATTWKIFKNIMLSDMNAQSCLTLWDPMDYSPPPNPQALLFMRFSRQEYWSGFPCPFPGDLPHPGIKSVSFGSPALVGGFLTTSATWEACLVTRKSESEVAQSCLTLCDHLDCSLPGSSIHGIFQARVLEWVAISFYNACMHAKSLQSCLTVQPYGQHPTRLLCPRDSLGKNTGVSCHFLIPLTDIARPKRTVIVWFSLYELSIIVGSIKMETDWCLPEATMASPTHWKWIWANSWEMVKDRQAWGAAVHGAANSWTQLRDSTTTTEVRRSKKWVRAQWVQDFLLKWGNIVEFDIDFGFLTLWMY